MMSEEEAKTKWCPFARYVMDSDGAGYPTGNRWGGHESSEARCLCIASQCMAFRWGVRSDDKYLLDREGNRMGYCGLAGEPR